MSVSLTVAVGAPVPITTGAVAVTADPHVQVYEITTGGTGGQEQIDLPPFTGVEAMMCVGRRVVFYLPAANVTAPGDYALVTNNGSLIFLTYPFGNVENIGYHQLTVTGVPISNAGFDAWAALIWDGQEWLFDIITVTATNILFASAQTQIVTANNAAGGTDQVYINPGDAGNGTAGSTNIRGGVSTNGNGGDLVLGPGFSTAGGVNGNILLDTAHFPTADPLVAGALWNSAGTLKVSAG